jgi:hypothetical protein
MNATVKHGVLLVVFAFGTNSSAVKVVAGEVSRGMWFSPVAVKNVVDVVHKDAPIVVKDVVGMVNKDVVGMVNKDAPIVVKDVVGMANKDIVAMVNKV